jgi:uncharacterized CHY-type Zn-finger protein
MKCPKCQHALTTDDVTIVGLCEEQPPVKAAIDIVVECPVCEARFNGFLFQEDLQQL